MSEFAELVDEIRALSAERDALQERLDVLLDLLVQRFAGRLTVQEVRGVLRAERAPQAPVEGLAVRRADRRPTGQKEQ